MSPPTVVVIDLKAGVFDVSVLRYEAGPPHVLSTARLARMHGDDPGAVVRQAVDLTRDAVVRAGLAGPPDAVYLVGEAGRMPLVAGLLYRALGVAPTAVDHLPPAPLTVSYTALPTLRPASFGPPVPHHVVPVVGVEAIALSLPSGEGVTLRGQLRPGYDLVEYIFPEVDGALPLFADFNVLHREAAMLAGDPLFAAPTWRMTPITDERRFDLAFVPEHLADGPDSWFPEYLTRCRDICAQLALFFELADVEELLKPGSLLDTLDDTLRRADGTVLGWKYRRQLARLNPGEVIRQWQVIVEAVDRLIRLTD